MRSLALVLLAFVVAGPAWGEGRAVVDRATVIVEKRAVRDWCVLDAQVSALAPVSLEAFLSVITDYSDYPSLFPDVREARVETVPGAVLLSEKVVVSAFGIDNVNRFTLRIVQSRTDEPRRTVRLDWTQERADGTIDSLSGGWFLEDKGTAAAPAVQVVYRNHSAVPVVVFGQDAVVRMFLGSRMRDLVEAVVKKAVSR